MSTALSSYMEKHKVDDAELASRIGRDRSIVNRLRRGVMRPTLEVAAAIEEITGGAVPMKSWVDVAGQKAAA